MRSRREWRRRTLIFLAVGFGMAGLALIAYGTGFLNQFERQTVDQRFTIRGKQKPPGHVVVVRMDTDTFNVLGVRPPFPRALHARVINELKKAGAKVIAYDVQFTEPTDPKDDNALINAVGNARNVVLATTEANNGHTNVFGGDDIVKQFNARVGNALLPIDDDGFWRHFTFQTEGVTSLSVTAAEWYLGRKLTPSSFPSAKAWIDYSGPEETIPGISFWKVLKGKFDPSLVRGKIVVVGPWAPTFQDIHPTPTSQTMPGPEIQANAIETVLGNFRLRDASTVVNVLLILFLGLLVPLVSFRLGPIAGSAVAVGTGGIYAVLTQWMFNSGWVVSFVYPVMALALSTVGALGAHYVLVAFERERVRDMFSRFVPEGVVDQVLEQTGGDLRLGGKEVQTTVMFSDLRGFTASAENMGAANVIEVLNFYLGEMSDAILNAGGTLISFMGDGIYALFGAPLPQEDHADRAIAASLDMLENRLPKFNAWMRERGLGEGYRMGIGLNTGSVMSGNVGHERRLEYTAVGDTVNTASRIEGMTKGTPYMLFVAETTYELLKEHPPGLAYHDEVDIRGRKQKLKLWGFEPAPVVETEEVPEAVPVPEAEPVEAPAQLEPT